MTTSQAIKTVGKSFNERHQDEADLERRAVAFADMVITLRRVTRRAVHANVPDDLTSSESELLNLLNRFAGISVSDAARLLQLSPNTVSTMVTSLRRREMVKRESDPADRRAAVLYLTDAGKARIRHIRSRRAKILGSALRSLSPSERDALDDAVPAMRQLLRELKCVDPGGGEF